MSMCAKETLLVFASFWLLYAATSSGDLQSDSEIRWCTAARLVDTGWFDLPPTATPLYATGDDGKAYSFYGPAAWGCLIPFVYVGHWLAALAWPIAGTPEMFGQFVAALLLFPGCGAFALVILYGITLDASGERWIARWITILVGLGTMHWHHSVSTGEEMQVAICVLTGLWALQRGWKSDARHYPLLVCIAAGLGPCFRISSVIVLGPLVMLGIVFDLAARSGAAARLGRLRLWLTFLVLGVLPFVAFLAWYNAVRFGSVFETGYAPAHLQRMGGLRLFETPLLRGMVGMLFSPGKGVFIFNPLLVLALPGLVILWASNRRLATIVITCFASSLLFHSKYTFWAGDFTWGPRYLTSLMGIAMLGLIPILRRRRLRPVVLALFVPSVLIQMASVSYSYALEFYQDGRHGTIPDDYVWRPAESQLVCRFRNIVLHVTGRPIHDSIPPIVERPEFYQITRSPEQVSHMYVVHFFPFKAYANLQDRTLFGILLALWLVILAALGRVCWCWMRFVQGQVDHPGTTLRDGST
jgi:hypothetical protein